MSSTKSKKAAKAAKTDDAPLLVPADIAVFAAEIIGRELFPRVVPNQSYDTLELAKKAGFTEAWQLFDVSREVQSRTVVGAFIEEAARALADEIKEAFGDAFLAFAPTDLVTKRFTQSANAGHGPVTVGCLFWEDPEGYTIQIQVLVLANKT